MQSSGCNVSGLQVLSDSSQTCLVMVLSFSLDAMDCRILVFRGRIMGTMVQFRCSQSCYCFEGFEHLEDLLCLFRIVIRQGDNVFDIFFQGLVCQCTVYSCLLLKITLQHIISGIPPWGYILYELMKRQLKHFLLGFKCMSSCGASVEVGNHFADRCKEFVLPYWVFSMICCDWDISIGSL